MLDVHAPEHRIGGFRDFATHLVTITVGLLIALTLENAVEGLHHRHLRREAEENITQEIRQNRDLLTGAAATVVSERADLMALDTALEAKASGLKDAPAFSVTLAFQESPIPDAAWQTASSTGVLSFMSYEEVERFSSVYKEQSLLQVEEERALDDYLELKSAVKAHWSDMTPQQAALLIPVVQRAIGHVAGMLAFGQGTLESYEKALKE